MRRFWLSVVAIVVLGACGGGAEPEGNTGGAGGATAAPAGDGGGGGSTGDVVNRQPPGQAAVSVDGQEFTFTTPGGIACSVTDEEWSFSFIIGDNEVTVGGGATNDDGEWWGSLSLRVVADDRTTEYVAKLVDNPAAVAVDGDSVSYAGPVDEVPAGSAGRAPAADRRRRRSLHGDLRRLAADTRPARDRQLRAPTSRRAARSGTPVRDRAPQSRPRPRPTARAGTCSRSVAQRAGRRPPAPRRRIAYTTRRSPTRRRQNGPSRAGRHRAAVGRVRARGSGRAGALSRAGGSFRSWRWAAGASSTRQGRSLTPTGASPRFLTRLRAVRRARLGGVSPEELVGRDAAVALVLGERLGGSRRVLRLLQPLEPPGERLVHDLAHASVGPRGLHLHGAVELRIEVDGHLHSASIPACWVAGDSPAARAVVTPYHARWSMESRGCSGMQPSSRIRRNSERELPSSGHVRW